MLMCLIGPPLQGLHPQSLAWHRPAGPSCFSLGNNGFIYFHKNSQVPRGWLTRVPRVAGPDPAPRSRDHCRRLGLIKSIVSPGFCVVRSACRGLTCVPLCCTNPRRARGRGEAPASSGMLPWVGRCSHQPFRTDASKSFPCATLPLRGQCQERSWTISDRSECNAPVQRQHSGHQPAQLPWGFPAEPRAKKAQCTQRGPTALPVFPPPLSELSRLPRSWRPTLQQPGRTMRR